MAWVAVAVVVVVGGGCDHGASTLKCAAGTANEIDCVTVFVVALLIVATGLWWYHQTYVPSDRAPCPCQTTVCQPSRGTADCDTLYHVLKCCLKCCRAVVAIVTTFFLARKNLPSDKTFSASVPTPKHGDISSARPVTKSSCHYERLIWPVGKPS